MGNWVSVMDCGAARVLLDTHPDVEFTLATGLQQTEEDAVRQQRQREALAVQQIGAKEAKVATLEREVDDLETQALNQRQILNMHAPGTAPYTRAIETARRAVTASLLKRKLLAKERKLIDIGHGILDRMQFVDGASNDHEYFENLRQLTAAVNPDLHARHVEELENAATTAVDNADALHQTQQLADGAFAKLDFAPVDTLETENSGAVSDADIIAALERMARERAPPPQLMVPTTVATSTASASAPSLPNFPAAPNALPDSIHSTRQAAVAVGTDGTTHDLARRRATVAQKKKPTNVPVDHYASLF